MGDERSIEWTCRSFGWAGQALRYRIHGHRGGEFVLTEHEPLKSLWGEFCDALGSISDEEIIVEFESNRRDAKSVSQALNRLIRRELRARGWKSESYIFAEDEYASKSKGIWRLDFAKEPLCVEVAFNHRSDIAWNLIKPTLASEMNHVRKAVQSEGGIVVTATEELKKAGGFDSAVGTYEDYVQYLRPMYQMLTSPLIIVGLEAPRTFTVGVASKGGRKVGYVKRIGRQEQ